MNLPKICVTTALTLSLLTVSGARAEHPVPSIQDTETQEQRDERMAWWREARFGMFIHWGMYAVLAGEWRGESPKSHNGEWIMKSMSIPVADYEKLAPQFNPVNFSADAWVSLAKAAGMKYLIITAKHHDGFAMFPSSHPFNISAATPFKRDPLKELADACKRHGIRLGFYYSHAQDWTAKGGANLYGPHWDPAAQDGDFDAYLREKSIPQINELLTRYEPAVIWFDTPSRVMNPARCAEVVTILNQHPRLIWNDRLGETYGGDTATPEQHIPPQGYPDRDWEVCMTMNKNWGYVAADHDYKPAAQLLRNLVDIASKGGNYLLNVGPDALGNIPPEQIERLQTIGAWMRQNSAAIYNTAATPFPRPLAWGRATQQPGKLYLHVFDWPADGQLQVPADVQVTKASLLTQPGRPLTVTKIPDGLQIQLPAAAPDPTVSVILVEYAGELKPIFLPTLPAADGTLTLTADHAVLDGKTVRVEHEPPNLGNWRNTRDTARWPVRVPAAGTYRVSMEYALHWDSAIRLTASGQTLEFKPERTGSWQDYRTVELGPLTLSAGDHDLTLSGAYTGDGAIINLRKLVLQPEKKP